MIIKQLNPDNTPLQNVKQRFFALRNGMLADRLRQSGAPYSIIFGLNLPQLHEVAATFGTDSELAETLWANKTTRESRLLAPMLAARSAFSPDDARRWLSSLTGGTEEVDVLCHELVRHLDCATDLIDELKDAPEAIKRYVALRLTFSKIADNPAKARNIAIAEMERNEPITHAVAKQLADEVDFMQGY